MIIDPTKEQFALMKALGDKGPVQMLNLIKLRDKANYENGQLASGQEAYEQYSTLSGPIFKRVGGHIVHSWDVNGIIIGPVDSEEWDLAFVAEYPKASAFVEMVRDETYRSIVFHRQAAVDNSRLVCLSPKATSSLFG